MLDEILHALSDDRRRKILQFVRTEEHTAGEIAGLFPDITRPAVSQHLSVLRGAGLVTVRREGTRRYYRLNPEAFDDLRGYLQVFWQDRLSRLKQKVEQEKIGGEVKMSVGTVLETSVHIDATPEEIFPYLVDPELMAHWMGSEVDLDPNPGGIYRVKISAESIARGEFTDVQPNQSVTFSFGWEGEGSSPRPGGTTVKITLEPEGDRTLVRLRHTGLTAEQLGPHTEGWEHYLARLAKAAAGRDPGQDPHAIGEEM